MILKCFFLNVFKVYDDVYELETLRVSGYMPRKPSYALTCIFMYKARCACLYKSHF